MTFDDVKSLEEANPDYTVQCLEDEQHRDVITAGFTHRIHFPVALVTREGGTCHRVVDTKGRVHCYPAPETGMSVITWVVKEGRKPVAF